MTTVLIEDLVLQTIPIYTLRKQHPVKKRPDCNMTRDYKLLLRDAMRKELKQAMTKDQENQVVAKYKEKVKEL